MFNIWSRQEDNMIISLIRLVNVCLRNMSGFQIVLKRKQNIWFCSEKKRFDTLCLQNNLFSEFCETSKWYFFWGGVVLVFCGFYYWYFHVFVERVSVYQLCQKEIKKKKKITEASIKEACHAFGLKFFFPVLCKQCLKVVWDI